MKKIWILLFCLFASIEFATAQNRGGSGGQGRARQAPVRKAQPSRAELALSESLRLIREGRYQEAVPRLYALSRSGSLQRQRVQIRYILGGALAELGYNQLAAFQFVEIIRQGGNPYVDRALERLSIVADRLGDDTLLNYAVSRLNLNRLPQNNRDILLYRLGEVRLRTQAFQQAVDLFSRVPNNSRYYRRALYKQGLALLEARRPQEALQIFQQYNRLHQNEPVTDSNRVAGILALARTYYQMKDWNRSANLYRQVPRDTQDWHDSVFEISWALLRGARFRSTLSQMQTLHSPFYEDWYHPESLIVRSIVYLFICRFEETEKTIEYFERTYEPIRQQANRFVRSKPGASRYFEEVEKARQFLAGRSGERSNLAVSMMRQVLREGDVQRSFAYLDRVNAEMNKLNSDPLGSGAFGAYGRRVLQGRIRNTRVTIGEMAQVHVRNLTGRLNRMAEQAGLIRFETINGLKEQVRKEIAGRNLPRPMVDEDQTREFYIQKGFEYWPFKKETWLDELGNYHYLGQGRCE